MIGEQRLPVVGCLRSEQENMRQTEEEEQTKRQQIPDTGAIDDVAASKPSSFSTEAW